ncbi:potassium-transporting ATPase subunit KdpA [Aurantimonas sp. VKM B-3413]|uniref:potassium-transporting ATPase subunit KdpA n=1 Tax=Aurantimonas sp. VKM B-3413 TaxID=2779401 RepID=UPI001E4AD46A|nr:potassium-transporting ATPase subunit KdpA [Aurantimonas sp. VKM B-3413]MCB8840513.1 potassium-transporting ATPase subunit KdpA [Aurantimonas sp. VKM B-3413]
MAPDILQFILYCVLLTVLAWPLGLYMARVFSGERTVLSPLLDPVEAGLARGCGVDLGKSNQHWTRYALAALAFNLAGWLVLYAILRLQGFLPFNPQGLPGLSPDLAFNTAVSFVTNTNWQAYGGETTMSYLSQMAGLTVQNFVSAGTGIAIGAAVIRGLAGRETRGIGNFWVDLARSILYLLLPLSILFGLFLVWQGVPQNLASYVDATTLEGARQTIAQGPAAAQIAIKQLGTNGGGFFNANSAVPYENPTPLANFFEMLAILLIPAAFPFMFGKMVKDMRQGAAIFAAMLVLFVAALGLTYGSEIQGNPIYAQLPIDQAAGSMEGKEVRFGTGNSALWATATTAASSGSVNSMHDSYTPLGMLAPMLQMQLGEIVFGGVGSGFYGMLAFVLLTVFIAGLMVGRTPEYLGKKIEAKEVKLSIIAFLVMPVGVLVFGAMAAVIPTALASVQDAGPHGLSEILYAYSSATGNNGSAFAGFGAGVPYHNTMQGIAMLLGRYVFIVPMLAIAGSLAAKKTVPASAGTFPTHTPLFVGLLVAVILIIGGLTFFPALALGPIAEQTAMLVGQTY